MAEKKVKLLVLDGQGVVFNAPIKSYLRTFAINNGADPNTVLDRWQKTYRERAWNGSITDAELWCGLADKKVNIDQTMEALHSRYLPGPTAPFLSSWAEHLPIWLLSNHRQHWLQPQLEMLGLEGIFEKKLVSDQTHNIKPDIAAFKPLTHHRQYKPAEILFVDDQIHNIDTAKQLGLHTIHATPATAWVNNIQADIQSQ